VGEAADAEAGEAGLAAELLVHQAAIGRRHAGHAGDGLARGRLVVHARAQGTALGGCGLVHTLDERRGGPHGGSRRGVPRGMGDDGVHRAIDQVDGGVHEAGMRQRVHLLLNVVEVTADQQQRVGPARRAILVDDDDLLHTVDLGQLVEVLVGTALLCLDQHDRTKIQCDSLGTIWLLMVHQTELHSTISSM
jgi:hypothetical protein